MLMLMPYLALLSISFLHPIHPELCIHTADVREAIWNEDGTVFTFFFGSCLPALFFLIQTLSETFTGR